MLARKSIKRLFFYNNLLKSNQIHKLSTHQVANNKLFLTDQYSKFTFGDLNHLSSRLSAQLLSSLNTSDLKGEKIAVLCSNNYTYLISLLAIWKANGVPLGLNKTYPINLIEYFLNDSKCKLAINGIGPEEAKNSNVALDSLLSQQNVSNFKLIENEFFRNQEPSSNDQNALESLKRLLDLPENLSKEGLILYTSGTSGPPKGVVLTRKNMHSTVETLKAAWEWSPNDSLLHVLPLNHVHGLSYALLTSFYSGAQCEMLAKFSSDLVWSKLLDESNNINAFMAVPTIFVNLVSTYLNSEELQKKYDKQYINHIFKTKIRLVASGSAPLNVKTYNEWNQITGYSILERYGMTEIGLGLSNVYRETVSKKRVAGAVGRPYGETTVRIVEPHDSNEDTKHAVVESYQNTDKILVGDERPLVGELQLKGDMIFREYHGKPNQTKETFTDDGWFKTGDTAEFLRDIKIYKLLGRTSVDVIKSGGYKISALDIEKEILAHPHIDDVSILGLSDPKWGQKIFALIVLKQKSVGSFSNDEFISWCKTRLPKYSVPKTVEIIEKMPRNQLGKVNKKELIKKYEAKKA